MALCEDIITAQTAEIEDMQTWLEDWYDMTYEPQMTKKMERQLAFLESLTGEAFEIAFLEMMIEHHMMAIKEGGKCVKKAYHEELIEMCQDIVATQSEEVMMMEMWLCDWYDICD